MKTDYSNKFTDELLRYQHVSCIKGAGSHQQKVLDRVSFTIHSGELVTLVGASGSGKSTLLRLAIGLDEHYEGAIYYRETDVREMDIVQLRKKIGLVLQLPYLFQGSVQDNILYGPTIHRVRLADREEFAGNLLDKVGLEPDLLNRNSIDLSVGQQMRVSLARTLANRPDLLLLDEPTAALDPTSRKKILSLIQQLNRHEQYTVIYVTHSIETARWLGGRTLALRDKTIAWDGPIHTLLDRNDSQVLDFMFSKDLD